MGDKMDKKILKSMEMMIKYKNNPLVVDRFKLKFFNMIDSAKNKNLLFQSLFDIIKTAPSSSANGFISIIALKKEPSLQFVLKTPKTRSKDSPDIEYNISKELTKFAVSGKIPNCVSKTWASIYCPPNYVNPGKMSEKLSEKSACIDDGSHPRIQIIMDLINGETLEDMIKKRKLSIKNMLNILSIVLCNIHLMRKRTGFTHYDLHYGNIMVETLKEERIFKYKIRGRVITIKSIYNPIIIDFGRTYINTRGNPKLKQKSYDYYYGNRNFMLIYERFYKNLISTLTYERNIKKAFFDILSLYEKLVDSKDVCTEYSQREQTIILSATFITKFILSMKDQDFSESDFKMFIYKQYYDKNNLCKMDITSNRENNICDFLKISSLIFEVISLYNRDDRITSIANEVYLNYPYLLPGQNFLPYNNIKYPTKTKGIFCLNDEIDLVSIMSKYNLSDALLSNNTPPKEVAFSKKYSLMEIYKPVYINLNIVRNILGKLSDTNYMDVDLRSPFISQDALMSISYSKASTKSKGKQTGALKRQKAFDNLNDIADSVESITHKRLKERSVSQLQEKLKSLVV